MNQLKDSFPKYFDLLKQFVNGKVTKPEFESELRKILPEKLGKSIGVNQVVFDA